MHLICLGIIKSTFKLISTWLSGMVSSKHKIIGKHMNDLIIEIGELNLDWCKVISLTTNDEKYKSTNWVSENYLGLGRLLLFIYAPVRELLTNNDERCIHEFECTVFSLYIFLSQILCNDADDYILIDSIIKVFLTSLNQFEEYAFNLSEKEKPTWMSKGNFLSLLNLPNTIKKYGPLRLYWDGNRERTIQYIKPFLIHTRQTPGYYKSKLCNVMRVQIIDNLIEQLRKDTSVSKITENIIKEWKLYNRVHSFKSYRTYDEIISKITNNKVLSCVIFKEDSGLYKTYICHKKYRDEIITMLEITFSTSNETNTFGLWYFPILCKSISDSCMKDTEINIDIQAYDFGMLVPLKEINCPYTQQYTVITKNWKVLTKNGQYSSFIIPKPVFSLVDFT